SDGDSGYCREDGVCRHGRDSEPTLDPAEYLVGDFVGVPPDVRGRNKKAHQYEQGHDTEYMARDCVAARLREQIRRDLKIAAHEVNADQRRETERDRDMHSKINENE